MKSRRVVSPWMLLLVVLVLALASPAADKKFPAGGKVVDAGSFGIFVNGRRVATETFSIEQFADSSVTKSELRVEDGGKIAQQTAELLLSSTGDLRRYSWSESSPGKAQAVVEPKDTFLIERLVASPSDKPLEQPYILPPSTMILDDYFFAQRELLAWRYLGSSCRQEPGGNGCKLSRTQFGVLIPRQRASVLVSMEYVGRESVNVRGQSRMLSRFNLVADGVDWQLWLDDNYHLIRVYIPAEVTEVVRD